MRLNAKKNKKLTQALVRDLFDYDPETGSLTWRNVRSKRVNIGDNAGTINDQGYRTVSVNHASCRVSRIIWLFVYGYLPENVIDHINRDRLDNRISNLREASRICNSRNSGNRKNNTSGVKGVHWYKRCGTWHAQIMINRKSHSLGQYKDFDEAVCARLAGEQCIGWAGCESNSPAFKYVKNNIISKNKEFK